MIGVIVEKFLRFIECPQCGNNEDFDVTEIQCSESFGPWACDSCGTVISGWRNSSGTFEVEPKLKHAVASLVLLKLVPQKNPLFFILRRRMSRNMAIINPHPEDEMEFIHSAPFFFNYECDPSIYLSDTIKIIGKEESEPRGVFEFLDVKEIPPLEQDKENENLNHTISKLFSETIDFKT